MNIKLCVFCPHFDWEAIGYTYHSTRTGGELSGGASCTKGHFTEYSAQDAKDADAFRTLIQRAETCPDYQEPV